MNMFFFWNFILKIKILPMKIKDGQNTTIMVLVFFFLLFSFSHSVIGSALAALSHPSLEDDFVLDFSQTQFNFIYPLEGCGLNFKFKGTNTSSEDIDVYMDQTFSEPFGYIHLSTPQGGTHLEPGESIWFKLLLRPIQDVEGIYNFTVNLRFVGGPEDALQDYNHHIFSEKNIQIKVVDPETLAGNVIIQGITVDEEGNPVPEVDIELGGYGGVVRIKSDGAGCFSYSIAESPVYFLIAQEQGYRAVTIEIDGNNVQDFYQVTLTREPYPIEVNASLINGISGNIGFWRCAATEDESKLLLVNGMENWENESLCDQAKLYLLDTNSSEILWTHEMGWESWTADITDDGQYVVFGTNLQWPETGPEGFINYIRLVNGTDGNTIWEKKITSENFPEDFSDGQSYTRGVKFSHNGEYIIVAVEPEYIYLLNRSDGSIKWRKLVSQNVREILFTQDDQYVYIPDGGGQLYKLKVEDGTKIWKQWIGCWAVVNGFDLSSDEKYIAVGAKGGCLTVINTEDGSPRFSKDGFFTCRFSPDGTKVIAGGEAFVMFDIDGNALWRNYCDSHDVRFSGDGNLVFTNNGQVFDIHGTIVQKIGTGQNTQVGWVNSETTRFIWAVRDKTSSDNNIIEVYSVEYQTKYPCIESDPTSGNFGEVEVGSNSKKTFTISNTGTAGLEIGTITTGGTDSSEFSIQTENCSGQTVAPSDTCTLDVVFSPTSESSKSASISISSNDPDTPTLNVPLSGTGITAGANEGDEDSGGGGCAIATACYRTPMAEELKDLCVFRDQYLLTNPAGRALVKLYYRNSPKVADFIRDKECLKAIGREILRPFIWIIRKIVKNQLCPKLTGRNILITLLLRGMLKKSVSINLIKAKYYS